MTAFEKIKNVISTPFSALEKFFLPIFNKTNINEVNVKINKIILWFYGMIFISTLFIIFGILKERKTICKSVILFGLIVKILYIIYLYTLDVSIYKYVICLFFIFAIWSIQKFLLKNNKKIYEILDIIILILYIFIGII